MPTLYLPARLKIWFKGNKMAQKLAAVPCVGPVIASAAVMKTPDPKAFASGRDYSAWIGLTPKNHCTAGKTKLGGITRAGDETLRSLLVEGAMAVIRHTKTGYIKHPDPWLLKLLEHKPVKLAAIALANKTARIIWKLMATDETCDRSRAHAGVANAAAAA